MPRPPFVCSWCLVGAALVLMAPAWGDDAPADAGQQSVYRSSVAQDSLRKQTDQIEIAVSELIKEMKLNGLDNAELGLLSSASGHLKTLSQEDMQKVIGALQSASAATEPQDRRQTLVGAYQKQQAIALSLKSVASDLAAEQAQKELPAQLENLIQRQAANIRNTQALGAAARPSQLDPAHKAALDVANSEQAAIGADVDLLLKSLAMQPDEEASSDAGNMAKAVLNEMSSGSLLSSTKAASSLAALGLFPDAVAKQAAVQDALSHALGTALAHVDPASQLQDAKSKVDRLLSEQKDLARDAQQDKDDHSALAKRQAQLEDLAAAAQARVKDTSPGAAAEMKRAADEMDKSRTALEQDKKTSDTAAQQKAAVDALEKTSSQLGQQIADAQKADAMSPTEKMAQLDQLQNEIKQAQQAPQTSADDLQKIQQDAAPLSPPAAGALADAADQMQKPLPDRAGMQQALAKASDEVQQQQKAMQQNAQDFQALSDMSQKLAEAQKETDSARQTMRSTPANLSPAAHDLTQAQANVDDAQKGTGDAKLPQDAKQALQEASDALKNGAIQAVQTQAANAQAQAEKASAALQKAQIGLGEAMAQIQQKGQGQSPSHSNGQPRDGTPQANEPGSLASEHLPGYGNAGGVGQVLGGLKTKDRDAITQYQTEKSPPEYAPLVQQYLKNLADTGANR